MRINTKLMAIGAFISYFVLDAITTCVAIRTYGAGAESNPAMSMAMGISGLAGFLTLKFIISLIVVLASYVLATRPGTMATGISALIAITAGGLLTAANNTSALLTGTSLFYGLFGDASFIGPGTVIIAAMFAAGISAYAFITLRSMHIGQVKSSVDAVVHGMALITSFHH